MIKTVAECDGPECRITATVGNADWPSSWIVINLIRHSGPLNQSTGVYGFHSRECLTAWTES